MSNNLWVLILSFFLTWSNVFSIKNKQAALNEIQQLPVVTADKGDEYATWDKVYNFLGKLEFNQDAEEIIEAIFKKYDKAKIPNSRSKIITQVIKKGADNLSKYQKHEIIVKNRAIRELSSFIIRLNTNYSNNAVSVSDLNLAEQLGIHIAILEFNKDSCDTILSIVELFKGYENFPGDIIKAIKTFVSKIVEALKKETPQTTLEKQNYNEKVKEFLEFTSKDEIKIYIKGIALPKFIEISTAWENFKKLRLQKDALVYIKNLIIKGLRVENIISNHLKTLNSSCGPKGALTEYINNEDGKKDEDFIAILMKTKKNIRRFL